MNALYFSCKINIFELKYKYIRRKFMQVISGRYRARKLKSPDSARPTLQRIKISTFSLIQDYIKPNIEVLDLFAGSGALGIECISRGAKFVQFVEKDKSAIACIRQNLAGIDYDLYDVMNIDYLVALKAFRENKVQFDVIFIDPPYDSGYYAPAVDIIERYNLLKDDGIIVLEMNKSKPIELNTKNLSIYKERDYGITKIMVLKRSD